MFPPMGQRCEHMGGAPIAHTHPPLRPMVKAVFAEKILGSGWPDLADARRYAGRRSNVRGNAMQDDEMLTQQAACAFFGGDRPIHYSTLYRGIEAGRYPRPV